MKKVILPILIIFCAYSSEIDAQVGLNTANPAVTLDVTAKAPTGTSKTSEGLLIPRVDRERAQNMTGVPTSTMVYINSVSTGTQTGTTVNVDAAGYYYYNGTAWIKLNSATAAGVNIYNADGTLTANRTVTQAGNTLAFTGTAANAFSIDASTFSVDAANHRVGIGTTNPEVKLDVAQNSGPSEATQLRILNTSPSAAGNTAYIGFNSYGGGGAAWGLGSVQNSANPTDNNFNVVYSNGSSFIKRLTIIPNGNVGIGTSTPGVKLDIAQDSGPSEATQLRILNTSPSAAGNTAYIGFNSYGGGGAAWGLGSTQNSSSPTDNNFNVVYSNGSSFIKRLTIIPNGNVGIGTSTPGVKLDIAQDSGPSEATQLRILNTSPSAAGNTAYIGFNSYGGGGAAWGLGSVQNSANPTDNNFNVGYSSGGGYVKRLTIIPNGNVGIGTSTPGVKLDVAQDSGPSEATQLRILNTSPSAAGNTAYIGFNSYGGGGAAWGLGSVQNSASPTDNNFNVGYSNGGNYMKRLTIIPNGNVGIGTSTPGVKLDVAQDAGSSEATQLRILNTSATAGGNTAYIGFNSYGGGGASWAVGSIQNSANPSDNNFNVGYSNGGGYIKRLTILTNGNMGIGTITPSEKLHVIGNILASGTITPSDIRIKKEIADNKYGLKEITKLRTITYKYKDEKLSKDKKIGFIAQEVKASMPELVNTANDEMKTLGVNYAEMTVVLTKAVQELQEIVKKQEEVNQKQQEEINLLKSKIK